ncbi:hypothetical protein WDA79_09900, partial [Streptomyces sp. A475]|uniref:hypothetical protein n=1 Tax=Streptomyces sp. A475 TaxID=3131976 RepID=UPI0030C912E9
MIRKGRPTPAITLLGVGRLTRVPDAAGRPVVAERRRPRLRTTRALATPIVHSVIDALCRADPPPMEAQFLSTVAQHRRESET